MKKQLLAVLFGSALVLGACGGGGDENTDEGTENGGEDQTEEQTGDEGSGDGGGESAAVNVDDAKKYFQQSCAGCHGADLSGNNGPSLQTIGSEYDKGQILDIIKNGKGSMPKNMAQGEQAETIAAWLATKK